MNMGIYTKKVGNQKCMKSIEDWYGVNKSTPDKWFERLVDFLEPFMEEIGYQRTNPNSLIEKRRGKEWRFDLMFSHPNLSPLGLHLSRKRMQKGGGILFVFHLEDQPAPYSVSIDTLSSSKSGGYEVMSRQEVGDKILTHIRKGWLLSRTQPQED